MNAQRIEQIRTAHLLSTLDAISKMLDLFGVPEWIENSDSDGVPSNAPHTRLRWLLSRRKNVQPFEVDWSLQNEMKENLERAKRYSK